MMEALAACCKVRSTPIFSMVSSVCRMPAVSMKRKRMPSMTRWSSMTSRVVPAMSLTMARSSLSKAFSSVLLPTLGLPAIRTGTPFFMTLPEAKLSCSFFTSWRSSSTSSRSLSRLANSTSSSAKSSSSSMREAKSTSLVRKSRMVLLYPPRNCCKAALCAPACWAEMRSATASA